MEPRLATLVDSLDRAYDVRSWHGPNLRGALRGVRAEEAARRPAAQRHNAWEVAVHCAYWKYRVAYLLDPDAPRVFDEKGSDWFARPQGPISEAAWRTDLERLSTWHVRLREAVVGFDPSRLDERSGRGEFTFAALVAGIAAHDLYHAGQIRLVRRLTSASG
jgi:hypothetical protein